ncbi:hypothetical protein GCM10010123_22490 [Pilimelia anulata]|uniref:Putative regulatory protein FmdB zinc ribbon domain-containing protein n=1 Tax=Pilimelia anulata TaxID=53371 RepID=A0A8J3FAG3_9ACTN|nr:FmdB family zinc ribbon protein [Pilimelia anulata]GGJ92174.1 hypothetical protein GCM10010123_22490 [Pilimelia anulata]
MPTYQYACTACGHQLEAVQSFSDPALTECPQCAGRLRKLFSAVGVVFKGSGFYRTDSRTGKSAGAGGSAGGSGADKGGDKPKSDSAGSSPAAGSGSGGSSGSTPSSGASSPGGGSAAAKPAAAKTS